MSFAFSGQEAAEANDELLLNYTAKVAREVAQQVQQEGTKADKYELIKILQTIATAANDGKQAISWVPVTRTVVKLLENRGFQVSQYSDQRETQSSITITW